jgi:hypothetical protein
MTGTMDWEKMAFSGQGMDLISDLVLVQLPESGDKTRS